MKILWRLLGYLRPYWARSVVSYACLATVAGFGLVMPLIVRQAIDVGLTRGEPSLLLGLGVAVLSVGVVRAFFSFGQRYLGEWLSQRVAYDLRNALYSKIQQLSFAYHDRTHTGQLISRSISDVESVQRFTGTGLMDGVNTILLLAGTLGILTYTQPLLTALAMFPIPILVGVTIRFGQRITPMFTRIQQQHAVMTTLLQEDLTGVQVVKAFARERHESERFRHSNLDLMARRLETVNEWAFTFPMMTFLVSIGSASILWFGGRMVMGGALTIGTLVAFNTYLALLSGPVQRIGWLVNLAAEALASGRRVFEILDAPSPVSELASARALPQGPGVVEFDHVDFGYDRRDTVLEDVTLRAEPGQVIGILGATGSGKSSIINLIPRFYDVTGGRVTIDSIDVRDCTFASLRQRIGIVLQDTFLFSTTIRENIAYGRPSATLDEIISAAVAAHAHEFIVELPSGYDTIIGERGVTLSGGQRQRVAIARALLMDPRVLILDDSTSSVDTETEHLIQQALARLMEGRTAFVIAQRVSSIISAHQILVLDRGRVVERGRHDELLTQGGVYAQTYALQQEQATLFLPELEPQEPAIAERYDERDEMPERAAPGGGTE